jgi:hypothetical protein
MNAKKAKALRRLVKQAAVDANGKPIEVADVEYLEDVRARKFVDVEKVSGDGKSTYKDKEQIAMGTIRVAQRSLKGIYKTMKKQYRQAIRG